MTQGVLRSLGLRLLLASVALALTLGVFLLLGRQLSLGGALLPIYVAFSLAFLIAGKEIYFGFGGPTFRRVCSYFVALGCMTVALYVLWHATAPVH